MDAQSRLRNSRSHNVDTVPVLVKSYMDSLSVSKAKIDSAAVESDVNDGRYYRLFAPLTFYHGVAGDMFSLEHDGDEQDYRSQIYTLIAPTSYATPRGNLSL